jgi:hypothetical protein
MPRAVNVPEPTNSWCGTLARACRLMLARSAADSIRPRKCWRFKRMDAVWIDSRRCKPRVHVNSMRRTQHQHVQPGGPQLIRGAPAELRWWAWLLDGAHPWGSFDAMVSRYGVRRYRLIIYPPGTTTADRRLARLWRGWPLGGVALAHDRRRYTEWQTLVHLEETTRV